MLQNITFIIFCNAQSTFASSQQKRCVLKTVKFLVMQLLGPNIGDLKKRSPVKRLSQTTVARIMIQGIAALRDVHSLGYIHRDVKPANMCFGVTQSVRIFDIYVCNTRFPKINSPFMYIFLFKLLI